MSVYEPSLPASLRMVIRIVIGAYAALIIWQSLVPASTGGAIPHLDKLLHGIVYAVLAAGISIGWPRLSKKIVLIGSIVLGAILELVQGVMDMGRTASVWDGLANSIGAAIGICMILFITRKIAR